MLITTINDLGGGGQKKMTKTFLEHPLGKYLRKSRGIPVEKIITEGVLWKKKKF